MSELAGKVAVVTGGSRGIGKAIAKKLSENGAEVAIIATSRSEAAWETLRMLKQTGRKAELYACDVSDADEVENTAKAILKDFGRVDILVNNAGITRDNLLASLNVEAIDAVIDVNLKGAIYMTRAFLRQFVRQKGGNVINLSSVVGLMGNKGQTNYAASKAGIVGFTKSVAKEYGKKNIRCNAIAPGYIATEMTQTFAKEQTQKLCAELPLGRLGTSEDVANVALFLVSEESAYITGEVIKVDGGMYV